jgi:hypothetical protein
VFILIFVIKIIIKYNLIIYKTQPLVVFCWLLKDGLLQAKFDRHYPRLEHHLDGIFY